MGWYEQTKSFIWYYTSVSSENTWFWNYGHSLTSILGQILCVHQVSSLYWSQRSCDNLNPWGLCPFVHNSCNNQIAPHTEPWLRDHHGVKCSTDSELDRGPFNCQRHRFLYWDLTHLDFRFIWAPATLIRTQTLNMTHSGTFPSAQRRVKHRANPQANGIK